MLGAAPQAFAPFEQTFSFPAYSTTWSLQDNFGLLREPPAHGCDSPFLGHHKQKVVTESSKRVGVEYAAWL
jgi:hypothetical protein